MREGRQLVEDKLDASKDLFGDYSKKRAKNVIVFIGDGMGLTTITAARIYKGQKNGKGVAGEREVLAWEKMPFTALAKVFATDYQVSDSSATANSYWTGVKTRKGSAGVSGKVPRGDCEASKEAGVKTESLFKWAIDQGTNSNLNYPTDLLILMSISGKSTGIVTTTRVTHGSEAPIYSSVADRDWEENADGDCEDIASQLIRKSPGKDIRVVLGGGRRSFLSQNITDAVNGHSIEAGKREDGADLIHEWIEDKKSRQLRANYVSDRDQLNNLDLDKTDFLFGLFSSSHMPYVLDMKSPTEMPSLAEMTTKALKVLQRDNQNGYVLFVEGK